MLDVCLLGTGGMMPLPYRWLTALMVRYNGSSILIDCGEGTQIAIKEKGWSFKPIDVICFTHYHGDHILGLPGLLQSLNFRGREKPLTIYGPKGLKKVENAIYSLGYCKFDFPIEFIEISSGTILETDEYILKSQEVMHNVTNLAYSIEEKKKPRFLRNKAIELGVPVGPLFGKLHNGEEVEVNGKIIKPEQVLGDARKGIKITYSGDTRPCEEMIEFAKNSTLLIHESTYTLEDDDKARENFHSTSQDAATIAKCSNTKRLVLTHISTRYTDTEDLLKEAKKVFENVEVADDLMTIEILSA